MSNTTYDINSLRNIILDSQHLLKKSSDSIEDIVSDICGLQYDPNPTIHLNQYIMLWNRKKDFKAEQLDITAYKEFKIVETWTFKRNMFFVPSQEYSLYRHATKGIIRWGESDEIWLKNGDNPEVQAAEQELKERLSDTQGLTLNQIWEKMNSGTFREPVYILKEKVGFTDWITETVDEKQAIKHIVEKLIASFGITDPVHISHISGYKTADVLPIFEELESENKISKFPYKIGRKYYYIHSSKKYLLNENTSNNSCEVRLISPMDTIVRDKAWLETFFNYSFTFEYFKKKGMKWPLSILVGNQFVGYIDCKMDWKTKRLIIKERNIFNHDFIDCKAIDLAIEELAKFHEAKEIVET